MEMPKIMQWFKCYRLHINTNKTVAILLHTRRNSVNIYENLIVVEGNTIAFTTNNVFGH